jgi:hypothetical protein
MKALLPGNWSIFMRVNMEHTRVCEFCFFHFLLCHTQYY